MATTLASSLLDFILELLRNPTAAAEFEADPDRALAQARLDDVCPADLTNLRMVLEDGSTMGGTPLTWAHASQAAQNAAAPVAAVAATPQGFAASTDVSPAVRGAEEGSVVEQLRLIQQTYTYNANTTIDARESVWAGQDVYALFGDDSVMATNGSVAARGDIEDVDVENEGSFNPETTDVSGNGNAVGEDNDVDNVDRSVNDSTGVIGGDGSIENATTGHGNVVGNELDVEVEFEDSFNDNSERSTEVNVSDSGNDNSDNSDRSTTDNSTDLDVELEDSFNDNSRELDVNVEDSLNDNSRAMEVEDSYNDESETTTTAIENIERVEAVTFED